MLEDPIEVIVGAVAICGHGPNGSSSWSAHSFTYTIESGGAQPSEYMVDTLLMEWGIRESQRLAPKGHIVTTNSSLLQKLEDASDSRRAWGKTLQGQVASDIWELLRGGDWTRERMSRPRGVWDKHAGNPQAQGLWIAFALAESGLSGPPSSVNVRCCEGTFTDLKRQSGLRRFFCWKSLINYFNIR